MVAFFFIVVDVEAVHVRKGMFFNPDPYVKIRIEPGNRDSQPMMHHYKETRTSVCENTTEPRWSNEVTIVESITFLYSNISNLYN